MWQGGVRAIVLLAAVMSALVSCSGSGEVSTTNGTDAKGRSTTPRSDFVSVAELRPIVALGYDMRDQPVLDRKQFDLEKLRGPCGATVSSPFSATSGFKVFRSTVTTLIEAIADPGAEGTKTFVDALEADRKDGCPSFEEQIGAGGPSRVQLQRTLTLPEVGERRIGWEQSVTAPDGKVSYRYEFVVAGGPRVTLLVVVAVDRLDLEQLNRFVSQAIVGAA